jgi:hypothetical protein
MNTIVFRIIQLSLTGCALAAAETPVYTNFIRQVQMPSGVQWDATVAATGEQLSALAIDPGGARFELWTVKASPLTSYLLDTRYVGAYIPIANIVIRSDDPYTVIPRTRADHPFYVDITVTGLLSGATDPAASKSVKLLRHVQSYGVGGTGANIDRSQAILYSQASINQNGTLTLTYPLTSIPGANRLKVNGEERFSVFSLADYQAPESQLASQYIQVFPVEDATIAGVTPNLVIRGEVPQVSLTLNNLYPSSTTYAQVYQGTPQLGVDGTVVPGSVLVINESGPQSRVLTLQNYDAVFESNGVWTMEILTRTPFGINRLGYVSFIVDRTISVNTTLTTVE